MRKHNIDIVRFACGLSYANAGQTPGGFYETRYATGEYLGRHGEKAANAETELRTLEALTPGRRLLDGGCSYGFFLNVANRRGWQVAGVELSAEAARYGRDQFGLDVRTGTLGDTRFMPGSFDVITLRHVLEQVDDPRALLAQAVQLVVPGRLVLAAVPDMGSLSARLFGADWWWIDPPTPLYYFDFRTLDSLLRSAGAAAVQAETSLADHQRTAFYALFWANSRFPGRTNCTWRLASGRRSCGLVETSGDVSDGRVWDVARRILDSVSTPAACIGRSLDRASLGPELLMVSQIPAPTVHG